MRPNPSAKSRRVPAEPWASFLRELDELLKARPGTSTDQSKDRFPTAERLKRQISPRVRPYGELMPSCRRPGPQTRGP